AIQQDISALPPTSGQSFVYDYDPNLGVPIRSARLAPISLRAPETVGKGQLVFRAAASYFALPASLGPINYRIDIPGNPTFFTKFGTRIDARVGVWDLTLNYGLTRKLEASLTLPIVLVDAQASDIASAPPGSKRAIGFRTSVPDLDQAIADGEL